MMYEAGTQQDYKHVEIAFMPQLYMCHCDAVASSSSPQIRKNAMWDQLMLVGRDGCGRATSWSHFAAQC